MSHYVLGTSMGEFAAATMTGVMDHEQALKILIKQAEVFEKQHLKGRMLAILADHSLFYKEPILYTNSEMAAVNFSKHFIISGEDKQIEEIKGFLKSKAIDHQPIDVKAGFHSYLIDSAGPNYQAFLKAQTFKPPQMPFISCAFAETLTDLKWDHLWQIVRQPIRFQETIQMLEQKGDYIYLDLGPSGTLNVFLKYNLSKESRSKGYPIMTPLWSRHAELG